MSERTADPPRSNRYWQSISIVLTGSVAAQSIPLLGSLIITRLYIPAEFGVFSTWLGAVILLAVMVTGRFEMALAVVPDGGPRRAAMSATLQTVLLVSLIVAMLGALAKLTTEWFDSINVVLALLFIPAVVLVAASHTWQALAAADGDYRSLSWIRVLQALVVTTTQIGAGWFSPTATSMVIGHVLGLAAGIVIASILMPVQLSWHSRFAERVEALLIFWREQRRFPMFALPADAINSAAGQLPILFIASKFGAEASGLYALTVRVLGAPIGLLGAAVLDVFKRNAAQSFSATGHCKGEYSRTFWLLLGAGMVLGLSITHFAEPLFVLAFGEDWRYAGTMAVWLVPMFALRFVASPLSYVFYIAGKQHVDLVWQFALLVVTIAAFELSVDLAISLKAYSAGYGLLYVIYIFLSYHYSKGESR